MKRQKGLLEQSIAWLQKSFASPASPAEVRTERPVSEEDTARQEFVWMAPQAEVQGTPPQFPAGSTFTPAPPSSLPAVGEGVKHVPLFPVGSVMGGQYVIVDFLDHGGMGEVYKAYDKDLNRLVAIKVVRTPESTQAQERLRREAQILAQFSHPNVIQVYQVGFLDDLVFFAMEFIDGRNLHQWMSQEKPTWQTVLQVFREIGGALAEAHKKSLLHRDIKPANVMMTKDDHAKLMDFGLAKALRPEEDEPGQLRRTSSLSGFALRSRLIPIKDSLFDDYEKQSISVHSPLSKPLTREHGIVGTPAYMAPEQFLEGEKVDEKADQFSYCVAFYEALYGKRPYQSETLDLLLLEICRKDGPTPPEETEVPTWLMEVVLKGLKAAPEDRYESIEELLQTLKTAEEEPKIRARRKKRIIALVLINLLLLTAVFISFSFGARRRAEASCRVVQGEMDRIWNPRVRSQVEKAFTATNMPYAQDAFRTVSTTLDTYTRDWKAMSTASCTATLVDQTQSTQVMDLRTNCLSERQNGLSTLVTLFATADATVVEKAPIAVANLGKVSLCADIPSLQQRDRALRDPELRGKVKRLRDKLASIRAYESTGKYQEGLDQLAHSEPDFKNVPYLPTQAEHLFLKGLILIDQGKYKEARDTLWSAYWQAESGGAYMLKADILNELTYIVGYLLYDKGALETVMRMADSIMKHEDVKDSMETLSRWFQVRGIVAVQEQRYKEGEEYFKRARDLYKMFFSDSHPRVADSINLLASAYLQRGDFVAATGMYEEAVEIRQRSLGKYNPTWVID